MANGPRQALTGLSATVFERALLRVGALRDELERLDRAYVEREDLPGTKILMRALRLLVGETERQIIAEGRRLAGRQSADRDEGFRRAVGGHITNLERLLPEHLSRARRTHGRDVEVFIQPLSRLANALSGGRDLIFDPVDRYEIVLSSVQRALERYADSFSDELHDAINHLPHVTVVMYPVLSEHEILQHAVIGHEIAHLALASPHHPGEPSIGALVFNQAFGENVSAVRNYIAQQGTSDALKARTHEIDLHAFAQRWFTELACDQVGARLVGPAMLLSLHEFAAVRNRWSQNPALPGYESHPGLAWRLERLVPEARRYLDVERNTAPWQRARKVIDELENSIPAERDHLASVLRTIIERALQLLDERLDSHLGGTQFLVGEFDRLFDVAWDKLSEGIPPAEEIFSRSRPDTPRPRVAAARRSLAARIRSLERHTAPTREDVALPENWSQPMDWRVIVNSAYFYWLSGAASDGTRNEPGHIPMDASVLLRRARFNEQIRGTIELSEIQLRLQEVKDQLDEMNFPEG